MEGFRGLTNFIAEIRKCKKKEEVDVRVEKELANIRKKFTEPRLSDYHRKKYVWKLVYIFMLGYEVEFGLGEVLNLIQAPSFAAKMVGYLSASVLMTSTSEQIAVLARLARTDLSSRDFEAQSVALSAIANLGGTLLADSVAPDVRAVLFSRAGSPIARTKAALVMLRLFRVKPDSLPIPELAERAGELLDDRKFAVRQAVLMLLLGVLRTSKGRAHLKLFSPVVPSKCTQMLLLLTQRRLCPPDYVYHHVLSPWFQVRLLRLLRLFPMPKPDDAMFHDQRTALTAILSNIQVTRSLNRNNAEHAILFEAMGLILKWGPRADPALRDQAAQHLARFVSIKEANIRYLGLVNMTKLAALPGTRETILKQQKFIFISFKEADISLRRAALDLLFVICGKDNAMEIVGELLRFLVLADVAIKEEMVLKIAILAERFAPDLRWYVDTILELIAHAGDYVTDDIWHRAVQIVTNHDSLQRYAAARMYTALEPEVGVHETAVRVGGYILGEFGDLLCAPAADGLESESEDESEDEDESGSGDGSAESEAARKKAQEAKAERKKEEAAKREERHRLARLVVPAHEQLQVLQKHFEEVSPPTKSLLLTTYAKMANLHEDLRGELLEILASHRGALDTELQQRSVEYTALPELGEEALGAVLDTMPEFAERESMLEARLKRGKGAGEGEDAEEAEVSGPAGGGGGDVGAGAPSGSEDEGDDDDEDDDDDDDDLLGLGDGDAGLDASGSRSGGDGFGSGGGDGFGDDDGFGGSGGGGEAPVRTVGIPDEATASLRRFFLGLIGAERGKVYEDGTVQVGAKLETRAPLMRLTLFFGNKSSSALTDLKVEVTASHGGILVNVPPGQPTEVGPGQQQRVELRIKCMTPFSAPLPLRISFLADNGTVRHDYPIRLPVVATHFCDAVAIPDDAFAARWKALATDERRTRKVDLPHTSPSPERTQAALKATLKNVTPLGPGFRAAGVFRTDTTTPAGSKATVGALARIAIVPGKGYRVETCAQNATIAEAVKASLVGLLKLD